MNASTMRDLILLHLGEFGYSVVVILGAILGTSIAYLVFRFGWRKMYSLVQPDYYDGYTNAMMQRDNKRAGLDSMRNDPVFNSRGGYNKIKASRRFRG